MVVSQGSSFKVGSCWPVSRSIDLVDASFRDDDSESFRYRMKVPTRDLDVLQDRLTDLPGFVDAFYFVTILVVEVSFVVDGAVEGPVRMVSEVGRSPLHYYAPKEVISWEEAERRYERANDKALEAVHARADDLAAWQREMARWEKEAADLYRGLDGMVDVEYYDSRPRESVKLVVTRSGRYAPLGKGEVIVKGPVGLVE